MVCITGIYPLFIYFSILRLQNLLVFLKIIFGLFSISFLVVLRMFRFNRNIKMYCFDFEVKQISCFVMFRYVSFSVENSFGCIE
jgi:hypothetical protein